MELKTAIEILEYHQEWRLGKRDDMIHEPKMLTEALDIVLINVKKLRQSHVREKLACPSYGEDEFDKEGLEHHSGSLRLVSRNCVNSALTASWLQNEGLDHCQCGFECKVRVQIERNGHSPHTYIVTKNEYNQLDKELGVSAMTANKSHTKQLRITRVIGSAYKHGKVFRCSVCGKFISYSEIDKNEVKVEYTPDTEYTVEETVFAHLHCL